jgi:hypothetical protein
MKFLKDKGMNRKGFVNKLSFLVIIGIALGILILIFGVTALFNKKIMYTLIGVGGIAVVLMYAFPAYLSGNANKNKTIVILLLLGGFVALILMANYGLLGETFFRPLSQTIYAATFTPVYCNQYEFTCCNPKISSSTLTITSPNYYICNSNECKLLTIDSDTMVGSTNCIIRYGLFQAYIRCDGDRPATVGEVLHKGDFIFPYLMYTTAPKKSTTFTVQTTNSILQFTGRSASTTGVTISSSSCVLTESAGTIYTKLGVNLNTLSYTVPLGECVLSWHSGDRTICGNLEEDCKADTDCIGHTYGNKECYARTLQTYGCNQLPLPSGVTSSSGILLGGDLLAGSSKTYSGVKSRCEIKSATTVQCCGDTDCGSNMVCDNTQATSTFTCEPKGVVCTQDSQCGVSTQCDYSTLKLKTPTCISGQCAFKTKDVECCYDSGCPDDSTCTIDKVCQKKIDVKEPCLSSMQCCIADDPNYFAKGCADSSAFCVNHICSKSPQCSTDDNCPSGQICLNGICKSEIIDEEECKAKASANPFMGYTWVEKSTTKQTWKSILSFGAIKPEVVNESQCYPSFIKYYIIGGVLGVAVIIVMFMYLPKKGRKKRR